MLKALYDYAVQRELALPPGYVNKTIKFYINLASDGTYLGLMPGNEAPVLCPDIGSLANSKDKSNVLAEKCSVVLDPEIGAKSAFFRAALEDGGAFDPDLLLCRAALDDPDTFSAICADADRNKVKGMDRLSFIVDGRNVLRSPGVRTWWSGHRLQFQKQPKSRGQTLCLITGEPTVPVATVPPVTGLAVVGGHSKGDALICFDKNAFRSYNLKQSANAPVSEEAFFTVKAGLDHLLQEAPVLAGMKFVHWYDKPVEQENDIILQSMGLISLDDDDEDEEDLTPSAPTPDPQVEERKATALVESVTTGLLPPPLASEYTILLLSGVNGRVMVRRYEHGSYEELQQQLALWYNDLQLCKPNGVQLQTPCKMKARLVRLVDYRKNEKPQDLFARMGKEIPYLSTSVVTAIIKGTPLPDTVAVRALSHISSKLFKSDNEQTSMPIPDPTACQWLKVWLLRKHRMENKEEALMEYYNPSHPEIAYHCGALVCVYGNIQHLVMPNVNASVVQRYYTSAMQTPTLVVGIISRQSIHHQEKITSLERYNFYQDLICKIYTAMGNDIPSVLTLEQQSLFALGYYQMQAKLNKRFSSDGNAKIAPDNTNI